MIWPCHNLISKADYLCNLHLEGNVFQLLEVTLHTRQSYLAAVFNSGRVAVSDGKKCSVTEHCLYSHTMCYKIYMMQFKTVWFSLCWSLLPHSLIHWRLNYIKELMTDSPVINITLIWEQIMANWKKRERVSFSDIHLFSNIWLQTLISSNKIMLTLFNHLFFLFRKL